PQHSQPSVVPLLSARSGSVVLRAKSPPARVGPACRSILGRLHRRALRRYLWPDGGWLGFHAAAARSLLNQRHPRPVNACRTIITQVIALPDLSGAGKTLFDSKLYQNHKVTAQHRNLAGEVEEWAFNREVFISRAKQGLT